MFIINISNIIKHINCLLFISFTHTLSNLFDKVEERNIQILLPNLHSINQQTPFLRLYLISNTRVQLKYTTIVQLKISLSNSPLNTNISLNILFCSVTRIIFTLIIPNLPYTSMKDFIRLP